MATDLTKGVKHHLKMLDNYFQSQQEAFEELQKDMNATFIIRDQLEAELINAQNKIAELEESLAYHQNLIKDYTEGWNLFEGPSPLTEGKPIEIMNIRRYDVLFGAYSYANDESWIGWRYAADTSNKVTEVAQGTEAA